MTFPTIREALEQAFEELTEIHEEEGASVELFREFLDHNELALAHDQLSLLAGDDAPPHFWDHLAEIADRMQLRDAALAWRRFAHAARHGWLRVLFECLPETEGGLRRPIEAGGVARFGAPDGGEDLWAEVYSEYGVPIAAGSCGTARLRPHLWSRWAACVPETELTLLDGDRPAGTVIVLAVFRGTRGSASSADIPEERRRPPPPPTPRLAQANAHAPPAPRAEPRPQPPRTTPHAPPLTTDDFVRDRLLYAARALPPERRLTIDALVATGEHVRAAEELLGFGCAEERVGDRFWDALQDAYGAMQLRERNVFCAHRRREEEWGYVAVDVLEGSPAELERQNDWDLGGGETWLARAFVQPRSSPGPCRLRIHPYEDAEEWDAWSRLQPGDTIVARTAGDRLLGRARVVEVCRRDPP